MQHTTHQKDKTFYIATANLLNFALPERTFYPNTPAYTQAQYQRKLTGLGQLLNNARADIIATQEVWDEDALVALGSKLGFDSSQIIAPLASNTPSSSINSTTNTTDSDYTQRQGAQDTPAVGLMSRFEITDWQVLTQIDPLAVVSIPDEGLYEQFNRPPLVATLSVYGQPLTVITAHLKSKRPHYLRDANGNRLEDYDNPNIRIRAKLRSLCMRAAEAAALRLFIIKTLRHTNHPLVLLGDMNDVTDSVTTQLMAETSEVIYDKSMRDMALFDAARVQTSYGWMKDVAYTHLYQGMPEVIDQLFVSEEFLRDSKFALGEVVRVDYFNDHLKWDYEQRVSDHGIVRAKLKFN